MVAGIVFNKLYVPASDPVVSTLLAYTTFAVSFVTRPLGGVIFGHFGDRIGRKSMLIITLMIMGVATFLIGLMPTYAQIGLAIGLCMASGIVALLSSLLTDAQFLAWGRRIAFLPSGVMVIVGMYIRLAVQETPEFTAVKARNAELRIPFMDMIRRYPGNVLKGMGAHYIDGVFFNVFGVFSINYLTNTIKISRTDALLKPGGGEPWQICMYVLFAGVVSAICAALIGRSKPAG